MRSSRLPISFGGPITPAVKWLLISNIAVFVVYFLTDGTAFGRLIDRLALTPRDVLSIYGLPQLVTYLFLHDPRSFWHVLFNMLMLFMFGCELERTWGTRRFLKYYFWCGIGAGFFIVLGGLIEGRIDTPTIGASGAIFGIMLAFGKLFPDVPILFALIIPIKARYFVMIMGAIAFLSAVRPAGGAVSHVAHLGGLVVGYVILRFQLLYTDLGSVWRGAVHDWKVRRARRKFDVYMRKRGPGEGPGNRFH